MAKPRVVALRTGEEIELTVWLKPLRKSAPRVSSAAVQRRIAHLDPVERVRGGIQPCAAQSARVTPSLHEPVAHNRLLEPDPLVVRADGCAYSMSRGGHRRVDRDVGARIHIPVKEKVAAGRDGARQRRPLAEQNLRIVPASARPGHGDRVRERAGHRETDVARAGSPRRGDRDRTRTERPGRRDLHAARLDRHAARERVGAAQDKRPRARLADRAAARDRLRDGLRSASKAAQRRMFLFTSILSTSISTSHSF